MVKAPRGVTTMFLSHTFLLLFLVVLATTEFSASPLHEIANAFVGSPDNGFHKLYTKIYALENSAEPGDEYAGKVYTHRYSDEKGIANFFYERNAKIETSNLNKLSLERRKILTEEYKR